MKSIILLLFFQMGVAGSLWAMDRQEIRGAIRSAGIVKKMEVCYSPDCILYVTSRTPDQCRLHSDFRLEWVNVIPRNPVIADLLSLVEGAKPSAQSDFDCRWYIDCSSRKVELKLYISGVRDAAIINGKTYSLVKADSQKFFAHFKFFEGLINGD